MVDCVEAFILPVPGETGTARDRTLPFLLLFSFTVFSFFSLSLKDSDQILQRYTSVQAGSLGGVCVVGYFWSVHKAITRYDVIFIDGNIVCVIFDDISIVVLGLEMLWVWYSSVSSSAFK